MNALRQFLKNALAVGLACVAPSAAAADVTAWRAVSASGPVEARPLEAADASLQWTEVRRGDAVGGSAEVRTGRRGRATLVRDADVIMVDPQSLVELPAAAGGPDAPVVQDGGSVVYEIDGTVRRGFSVVTPYLVAGVKGTVFLVTVGDGYASVTVREGVVAVTEVSSGERIDVVAGQTAIVEGTVPGSMTLVGDDASQLDRGVRQIARHESTRLDRVLERDAFLRPSDLLDTTGDLVSTTEVMLARALVGDDGLVTQAGATLGSMSRLETFLLPDGGALLDQVLGGLTGDLGGALSGGQAGGTGTGGGNGLLGSALGDPLDGLLGTVLP